MDSINRSGGGPLQSSLTDSSTEPDLSSGGAAPNPSSTASGTPASASSASASQSTVPVLSSEPEPLCCGAQALINGSVSKSGASNFIKNQANSVAAPAESAGPAEKGSASPYAHASGTSERGRRILAAGLGKLRDAKSGVEVELSNASVELNPQQLKSQLTVNKVGISSDDGNHSISVKSLSIEGHYGVHNADGSTGFNIGRTVDLLSVEAKTERGGNSLSFGVSAGFGASGSVGLRDKDKDGLTEVCGHVAVGPISVGACVEPASDAGLHYLRNHRMF